MYVVKAAKGSGEQWVRNRFPVELGAYRERRTRAASALMTIIDADSGSVDGHINELKAECISNQVPFRTDDDAVAIAVPKRNIETWIHYLRGNAVSEQEEYRKLNYESECRDAVKALVDQCHGGGLSQGAPPSLVAACEEYKHRMQPAK